MDTNETANMRYEEINSPILAHACEQWLAIRTQPWRDMYCLLAGAMEDIHKLLANGNKAVGTADNLLEAQLLIKPILWNALATIEKSMSDSESILLENPNPLEEYMTNYIDALRGESEILNDVLMRHRRYE